MTSAPRVAITGAGGFIGQAVSRACPRDWNVVTISRRELPPTSAGRHIRIIDATEALPSELDAPFDAVIHVAGNADHGLATREPWRDLISSGVVAAALLSRLRASRLVVLSSAAVYAGLEGRVEPGACLEPPMAYALSKRYVEGLAGALVAGGRYEAHVVIRLYNAYGPGERSSRLVPRVAAAVQEGSPFVLHGDPASLSDPVHVDDLAAALIGGVTSSAAGTFDLCGGAPLPLVDRVSEIARILGANEFPVVADPDPTQTPIRFWSDPRPTCRALGIEAPRSFESGVRQYAAEMGWLSGSRATLA